MFHILSTAIIVVVFGLPLAVATAPAILFPHPLMILITLFFMPIVYSFLFVLTAGLLSRPFQKAIVPGKFARDLRDPLYRGRRLYGLCWICVYYSKPVYFACLSIPFLKTLLFRLFGYRGQMDFTIYPDTWIRDLPLLDFGQGAYIANRVTLGTNMPLSNGKILVDRITIGRQAMIGHLTIMAPGARIGDQAELGTTVQMNARCTVGAGALVQPGCKLDHRAVVGEGAAVGTLSYVGPGAKIGPGISVPSGAMVPSRAKIQTQEDADRLLAFRFGRLSELLAKLSQLAGGGGLGPRVEHQERIDSSSA